MPSARCFSCFLSTASRCRPSEQLRTHSTWKVPSPELTSASRTALAPPGIVLDQKYVLGHKGFTPRHERRCVGCFRGALPLRRKSSSVDPGGKKCSPSPAPDC